MTLQGKQKESHANRKGTWCCAEMSRFDQSTLLCSSDFVLEHAYCWSYLVPFQHGLRVQRCMSKGARMTLESDSKIPQFIAVFAQLRSQRVFLFFIFFCLDVIK